MQHWWPKYRFIPDQLQFFKVLGVLISNITFDSIQNIIHE